MAKILFLRKFGFDLENTNQGYPIYIAASELQEKPLLNYLLEDWLERALAYTPDQVEVSPELKSKFVELFKIKKVWLLIDIDKLVKNPKQILVSILNNQATGFLQEANVIITCKTKIWRNCQRCLDDSQFNIYNIQPLTAVQVEEYIKHRFHNNPQLGEELYNRLTKLNNPRIAILLQNPSYLVRLCENWSARHKKFTGESNNFYEQFQNTYAYWKFLILGS